MKWLTVRLCPLYEVSDEGRVRRIDTMRELALTPRANGYVSVSLSDCNMAKRRYYVHRLVADALFCEIQPGLQINHINFVRHDNRAENLEIVTCKQNAEHSKRAGRLAVLAKNFPRGEAVWTAKLDPEKVGRIREWFFLGERKADLARAFGVTKTQIANVVHGRSWAHG